MTPSNLPALNWLGYSLDLTTVTPNDIKAVSIACLRGPSALSNPVTTGITGH